MASDHAIIEQVTAACQAGMGEAAQALTRALGEDVELSVPESGSLDVNSLTAEFLGKGGGLLLVIRFGSSSALFVLPESSGMVPSWCSQADATSQEKLTQLALELGTHLLPEPYSAKDATGAYIGDLGSALLRAGLAEQATRITMQIRAGAKSGVLSLIWPASQPDAALHESPAVSRRIPPIPQDASESGAAPSLRPLKPKIQYKELEDGLVQLPAYSRSLLKIKVPVMVTLAQSKQPVENVLGIGPGSIIHFNKPCEDSLTLEIDGQKVALGEAVKVGDKFGLWITSMILPEERFWVINNCPEAERAK